MLIGQEIGLLETLMIVLLGMVVAMASLALLMGFVIAFSKPFTRKQSGPPISQQQTRSLSDFADITEEEMAAIAASIGLKQDLSPDQFAITSITPHKNTDKSPL